MSRDPEPSLPRAGAPAELDSLSATLAAAFADDPVFGWLIPAPQRRLARLRRFFRVEIAHVVWRSGGCVWASPDLAGASLELPPGRWRMPLTAQLAHGPAFTRVFGARLAHALALITRMEHSTCGSRTTTSPTWGWSPARRARVWAPGS